MWTFVVPAFLLGLLFGSFLNVCIFRLPEHRSIAKPRSHCPQCTAIIRWYDNLPLLSFVLLRAKCRKCGVRIPWRYPLVELAVGLWFGRVAYDVARIVSAMSTTPSDGLTQALIIHLGLFVMGFLLIGLGTMDWETHKIPDSFTLTGIAFGLFTACVQSVFLSPGEFDVTLNTQHNLRLSSPGSFTAKGNVFLTGSEHLVFGRVAAVVAAALVLYLIRVAYKRLRGREGMGLGDIKMVAMIAAFLGFWPTMLAFFIAIVLAAVYGSVLLLRRTADRMTRLPFGAFLAAAGLFCGLYAHVIVPWYKSLL